MGSSDEESKKKKSKRGGGSGWAALDDFVNDLGDDIGSIIENPGAAIQDWGKYYEAQVGEQIKGVQLMSQGNFNNAGGTFARNMSPYYLRNNAASKEFTSGETGPERAQREQRETAEKKASEEEIAAGIYAENQRLGKIANILEGSARQRLLSPGSAGTRSLLSRSMGTSLLTTKRKNNDG